jgi:recombination protein RecT
MGNDEALEFLEKIEPDLKKIKLANKEEFSRIVLSEIRRNDKLMLDRSGLGRAILGLAQLKLILLGPLQQVRLWSYYSNKLQKQVTTLDVGYRGWIELMMRTGSVESIYGETVKKGDKFSYQRGTDPKIDHFPMTEGKRGELTHIYAVAFFKSGGNTFVVLDREYFDLVKSLSKNEALYKTFEDEMGKKIAMKNLIKTLQVSVKNTKDLETALAFDYEAFDLSHVQTPQKQTTTGRGTKALMSSLNIDEQEPEGNVVVKRRRGRPRKNPKPED